MTILWKVVGPSSTLIRSTISSSFALPRSKTCQHLLLAPISSSSHHGIDNVSHHQRQKGIYTTTTIKSSSIRSFSSQDSLGPNQGLGSVIEQGSSSLQRTAIDVQAKTKKVSSLTSDKEKAKTPRQLAESQRILEVATECIEALCNRTPNNPLAIGGEPLTLLQVHVNSTARLAKVYWTLPYSILLDKRLTPTAYRKLMTQVEARFDGSLLQRDVHTRLSFYFPPRLKFYPATPQMVAQAMHEWMDEQ